MFAITSYDFITRYALSDVYTEGYICIWFKVGKSQKSIVKHSTKNIASIKDGFNILFKNWDLRFKI